VLARSRRFAATPLVALLAASPVIMQNVTYTWTKLLMAVHYLVAVLPKRPQKGKELAIIAVSCGMLLATWFGWSMAVYGTKATVASNTSITEAQSYPGSNLQKIAANLLDTLVPHPLRDFELVRYFDQPNPFGGLRDNIFIFYQMQLIFTMGLIGGPLVLLLLWRGLRRNPNPPATRTFWWWLIGASVAIGLAVVGERNRFGLAHLTLLPVEILGLTLLAARFRRNRTIALLLIAGCVIDFSAGVFLHLGVEHLENTADHTYYVSPTVVNGRVALPLTNESFSSWARENWFRKHQQANVKRWRPVMETVEPDGRPRAIHLLNSMASDDPKLFHGWYSRHGGEITFLGDHIGESDIPSGLMLIGFAYLLWSTWRMVPAVAAPVRMTAVESKSARSRKKR
jgi:hypothetical protein